MGLQTSQDSTSDHNEIVSKSTKGRRRRISRSRSRKSRTSQEDNRMETEPADQESHRRGSVRAADREGRMSVQEESQVAGSSGSSSSSDPSSRRDRVSSGGDRVSAEGVGASGHTAATSVGDDNVFSASKEGDEPTGGGEDSRAKLRSLVDSLTDYCVRVVKFCPDLSAVLTSLNECHAHEVQLFFRAVRSREPKLMGQLQEQLLDTGSHNRLVTILSDMYA